jgi:Fe-S-cluster containining protein
MNLFDELQFSVRQAFPLFEKLSLLNKEIPETDCRCNTPGVCCGFLPEMTLIEALQWLGAIWRESHITRQAIVEKFVGFYLQTPFFSVGCPFLVNGTCGRYEIRPFACRAYGLWSQEVGIERTRQNAEVRKVHLDLWKRFGIVPSGGTLPQEMEYCTQVSCRTEKGVTDQLLMKTLEMIYHLDESFPVLREKFEKEYFSDFSFLVASAALGQKKAILGKYASVKEMLLLGKKERYWEIMEMIAF